MTPCGEALPAEHLAGRDPHVRLGHGGELTPERVEQVAVETACGLLQPRRVDEVRRTDLRHPHGKARVAADERARRAGMVEVDVREQQVPDVGQLEPVRRESRVERLGRRAGAGVEERRPVVGLDEVHADRARAAAEVEVDQAHDYVRAATERRTSAASRSASRSSAASMPTDRRTRLPGGANGAPAVEACVIRAGCSIRLSTPPSDSASWKMRVRATKSTASASLSIWNETMPPKSRICRRATS